MWYMVLCTDTRVLNTSEIMLLVDLLHLLCMSTQREMRDRLSTTTTENRDMAYCSVTETNWNWFMSNAFLPDTFFKISCRCLLNLISFPSDCDLINTLPKSILHFFNNGQLYVDTCTYKHVHCAYSCRHTCMLIRGVTICHIVLFDMRLLICVLFCYMLLRFWMGYTITVPLLSLNYCNFISSNILGNWKWKLKLRIQTMLIIAVSKMYHIEVSCIVTPLMFICT